MKKVLLLLVLMSVMYINVHAGLSKIKSVKIITTAKKSEFIKQEEIDNQVIKSFANKLPQIKVGKSGKITCEVRYSDGYFKIEDDIFGSYYLGVAMKSDFKKYDKISPSRKTYWERGFFMPSINSKDLGESVKNNIDSIIDAFVVEWYKDKEKEKK
ncbi:hypothetical protein ACFL58_01615 [Elusimicrobiota bacterium]